MGYFVGANKTAADYEKELSVAKARRAELIAKNDTDTAKIAELTVEIRVAFTNDYSQAGVLNRQIKDLASEINARRGQILGIERSLPQISLMASVASKWDK